MSKATTVAVAGGALIAVNGWYSPQRQAVSDILNGKANAGPAGHRAILQIGGEALVVLVAVVAAGSSDNVGTGMIAAIVALWVLWSINHFATAGPMAAPGARPVQPRPAAA